MVVAGRDPERGHATVESIREAGGECSFIRADMGQPEDIEALILKTVELYGRLDCAFNNAASAEGVLTLTADLTEEQFDRGMAVNVKGVWLCMKYEIQQMLKQSPAGGAIVNTSSVNGLGGARQAGLYAASKSAVIALTKSAALEYAHQGIRINALVPGPFRTPMLEGVMDQMANHDPEARHQIEQNYEGLVAAGRIGEPSEAAQAVLWLCSDASSYVVGHALVVDGGMSAVMR